jgi:hypothetical protein
MSPEAHLRSGRAAGKRRRHQANQTLLKDAQAYLAAFLTDDVILTQAQRRVLLAVLVRVSRKQRARGYQAGWNARHVLQGKA